MTMHEAEVDLERGANRVDAILHPDGAEDKSTDWVLSGRLPGYEERFNERGYRETRQVLVLDAAEQAQSAQQEPVPLSALVGLLKPPAAPPARRKPVKGKCIHCGKYHSAHIDHSDGMYCYAAGGPMFDADPSHALNYPEPAPAPPATAGGLTGEQNNRLQILLEDVMQAERNYWTADQKRVKAGIAYNAYLDSLTVRP